MTQSPDIAVPAPEPSPDSPAETYAVLPETVWEAARRDYLKGESSTDICRRYGLARSTFHARAAREGWRRMDQPQRTVSPFIELEGDMNDLGFFDLSEMAVMRLRQAILSGRSTEAAGWLAMVRQLRDEGVAHDPPAGWDDNEGPAPNLDSLDKLDRSSGVQPPQPANPP